MKIKLTTLVVILILVVAGTVGVMLLITNKDFGLMRTERTNDNGIVINEQENVSLVEEKISNEIEEKNKEKNEEKEISVNSEVVKNAYVIIPKVESENDYKMAYQSKKITFNDLPNKVKLVNIVEHVNFENEKIYPGLEDGGYDWFYFDEDVLVKKAKELYGEKAVINHEKFGPNCAIQYVYKDGRYLYSYGGQATMVLPVSKMTKATTDNENLYIYDKFVFVIEEWIEEPQQGIIGSKYNIYTNSEQNNKVAEIDMEPSEIIDDVEKYVLEKYSDKMATYKHTFKKDENGNYYWYSTEPVETK